MECALLGKRLKALRKERKLSLDELSALTGCAKSYLWSLENRDNQNPSSDKLIKLTQALDVTIDYLLAPTEKPSNSVMKESFFRKFEELSQEDQKKIELIVDAWRKTGEKVELSASTSGS